ncbi:MAG: ABC transporter permease subunit [Bacteroidales bacterium]
MINFTLFKQEIKRSYFTWIIFTAILTMYISLIITMYHPAFGKTLDQFTTAMPQLMSMFGMSSGGVDLVDFMANYLYGFLMILFPMVFIIIEANKLVAKHVDQGTMSYLLASPNTRMKVIVTQICVLVTLLLGMLIFCSLVEFVCACWMYPGKLNVNTLLRLNTGLFALQFAIAGFCFFSSCISNDTKRSLGIGAGVPVFFYLVKMLGNMGGQLHFLNDFTPFSLFNVNKLIANEANAWWMLLVLIVMGKVFFCLGVWFFKKKDLPL